MRAGNPLSNSHYSQGWLTVTLLLCMACLVRGADGPPMPPGFATETTYYVPSTKKVVHVPATGFTTIMRATRLVSPKGSEQLSVPMARPSAPTVSIFRTCAITLDTNTWTVTAITGNGKWNIESSTNLVNWRTELSWREFCLPMPGTKVSLTGERNERRQYFRNRIE